MRTINARRTTLASRERKKYERREACKAILVDDEIFWTASAVASTIVEIFSLNFSCADRDSGKRLHNNARIMYSASKPISDLALRCPDEEKYVHCNDPCTIYINRSSLT